MLVATQAFEALSCQYKGYLPCDRIAEWHEAIDRFSHVKDSKIADLMWVPRPILETAFRPIGQKMPRWFEIPKLHEATGDDAIPMNFDPIPSDGADSVTLGQPQPERMDVDEGAVSTVATDGENAASVKPEVTSPHRRT